MADRTNFERHTARTETRKERDRVEESKGYANSGEGMWSRSHATGHGFDPNEKEIARIVGGMNHREQLIYKNCRQLVRLEELINTETDPSRIANAIRNALIKKAFIEKLRREGEQ
jgi:hypothetical protein